MTKKNRPKKSKALVVWAIVTVIVLLADCVGNYLVVGLPGSMNSLLDKPMAAIGEAIDFKLSAGELGGLMDTLFGSQRPIYSDEVTSVYPTQKATNKAEAFANAQEVNLKLAEEGFVLLKNENAALPMNKGARISVFSKNSVNLSYGGSGSGGFDTSNNKNLYESLNEAGFVTNPTLKNFYESSQSGPVRTANSSDLDNGDNQKIATAETPQNKYTDAVRNSYADYSDAALVVITRIGGEGFDLPRYQGDSEGAVSPDSHYLELDQNEIDLLTAVTDGTFKRVVVVFNTPSSFEATFLKDSAYAAFADKIDAAVWIGFTGSNGITALGEILNGDVNPSGRLVDTYVHDNLSSAAMQNFGDYRYVNEDGSLSGYSYVNYAEGIYVGYKYYETRYEDAVLKQGNAGDYDYAATVAYPFGYGLSYTDFEWSDLKVDWDGDLCTASVTVKNTGFTSGKDVVEFYVQSPYIPGGVEKAAVALAQYVKTSELAPGESQRVSVTFSKQDIASYDAKDAKTYVIDAGDWYVTAAHDAHEAVNNVLAAKGKTTADGMTANGNTAMAAKYTVSERELLNKDAVSGAEVTNQLDDIVYADDTVYLSRSDWSVMDNNGLEYATGVAKGVSNVGNISGDVPTYVISDDLRAKFELKGFAASLNPTDPTDAALYPGKEAYTYGAKNNLKLIDMVGLDYNDPKWDLLLDELKLSEMHQLFNKSGWGSLAVESVGKPKTYEYDAPHGIANFLTDAVIYSYPCATMTAATWSQDVQRIYGNAIGEDAIASNTEGWYAPGINIHRTPFGARNYEYYSEDAVLTGLCSAAVCAGVEAHGMHAYIKHFVMNDADTNRAANGCVAVWGTEQATREIYLKPFQYSIQKGGAQGIMLTMCRVGWQFTFGSYPLMSAICRNEWGWHGCYITDYTTTMKGAGADQYLAAGGTLIHATAEQSLSDVKSGWCRKLIREAVHQILYNTANSLAVDPAYAAMLNQDKDGAEETTAPAVEEQKGFLHGMAWYKVVLYGFDILMALVLVFMAIRVYSKVPMTEEQFQNRKRMSKKGKRIMWIVIAVAVIAIAVVFYLWAWPLLVKAFKI